MVEDGAELFRGHLFGVTSGLSECAQQSCSPAVFGRCNLFEVVERPIKFVAVDVVDLKAFGAWTDESLPNEMVTETSPELAHLGVRRMHVRSISLLCRIKVRFEFFAVFVKESSVRSDEQCFAAHTLGRYLFDDRYIHNALAFGDGLLSESECKGRGKKVKLWVTTTL